MSKLGSTDILVNILDVTIDEIDIALVTIIIASSLVDNIELIGVTVVTSVIIASE